MIGLFGLYLGYYFSSSNSQIVSKIQGNLVSFSNNWLEVNTLRLATPSIILFMELTHLGSEPKLFGNF